MDISLESDRRQSSVGPSISVKQQDASLAPSLNCVNTPLIGFMLDLQPAVTGEACQSAEPLTMTLTPERTSTPRKIRLIAEKCTDIPLESDHLTNTLPWSDPLSGLLDDYDFDDDWPPSDLDYRKSGQQAHSSKNNTSPLEAKRAYGEVMVHSPNSASSKIGDALLVDSTATNLVDPTPIVHKNNTELNWPSQSTCSSAFDTIWDNSMESIRFTCEQNTSKSVLSDSDILEIVRKTLADTSSS